MTVADALVYAAVAAVAIGALVLLWRTERTHQRSLALERKVEDAASGVAGATEAMLATVQVLRNNRAADLRRLRNEARRVGRVDR